MSSGFYACQSRNQFDTSCHPYRTSRKLHNHLASCCLPESQRHHHSGIVKPSRLHADYLSESLRLKLQRTIRSAWQNSTLGKYENSINRFIKFCDNENIPFPYRLPASEFLLCAFTVSSAGLRAGDMISSDLSAVCAWHIINDVPYKGSLQLKYTLKGARNLTPGSSKRPLRPPVSWEMLEILVRELDQENTEDICVLACALAATSGQARLGELLPTSMFIHDPLQHPSVSDLQPPVTVGGSRALKFPHTKMTGNLSDVIFLCSQNDCTDPNSIIDKHIKINQLPLHYPLFSYRYGDGCAALTKRKFLTRCNDIWSRYGLPMITGHCFRIGGTTILLLRGVSPDIVKRMGRWSSDAFLKYWQSLEILAPLHTELLAPYISTVLTAKKTNC